MSDTAIMEPPVASAPTPAPAAPVVAPVPAPVPETPTIETFTRDSAAVLPDVLIDLVPAWTPSKMAKGQTPAPVAPTPVAAPAPVAPAPAPAPAPEVPSPVVAVEPATPPAEAAPDFTKNWRIAAQNAKDAAVLSAVKNGVSMIEAVREVYGEQALAPATPPAPAPISPPPPEPDPVLVVEQRSASLAQEVADLGVKIDAAAESGDTKTAFQLLQKQNDLKISLDTAKKERESIAQQVQESKVNAAVENHRKLEQAKIVQVFELYPNLAVKNSPERHAFNEMAESLKSDPAFGPDFREKMPGWPLMVANMVASEQGWSRGPKPAPAVAPVPVAAPAAPTMPTNPLAPQPVAPPPPVPPVRATSAALISPSENPGGTTPVINADTFLRDSANATPAQLIELMKYAPIDPKLLKKAGRIQGR